MGLEAEQKALLNEIKNQTGRVQEFTLGAFFVNLWLFSVFSLVLSCFCMTCYRRIRGDQQTFIRKLNKKARGLRQNY